MATMQHPEPPQRRILLGLDAVGPSIPAISFALTLAARLQAQLDTLLLTQAGLARAAALPFATEVSLLAGLERRLDDPMVRRSLQALYERLRLTMTQLAGPEQVRWSLQLAGWTDWEGLLARPSQGSLFVLGHVADQSSGARRRLGKGPAGVCVVYDETPSGQAALQIATLIDPEAARLRMTQAVPTKATVTDPDTPRLIACLNLFRPQTVVLPANWYAGHAEAITPVLAHMECTLLLVG
jgi:hypothetical protein